MTDLTPNDLSHLSDEEFIALCPQGEHAPGPEPPPTNGPNNSDVTELFYRHMGEGSEGGFENAIAEVLTRWGHPATPPPEPPMDGEVAELVAWLRLESEDWRQANPGGHQGARLARAAELLERTATPPPEPNVPNPLAQPTHA